MRVGAYAPIGGRCARGLIYVAAQRSDRRFGAIGDKRGEGCIEFVCRCCAQQPVGAHLATQLQPQRPCRYAPVQRSTLGLTHPIRSHPACTRLHAGQPQRHKLRAVLSAEAELSRRTSRFGEERAASDTRRAYLALTRCARARTHHCRWMLGAGAERGGGGGGGGVVVSETG